METVANILQIVADLRGETSVDTSASRIRAVANAEQDFAKRRLWLVNLLRNRTLTGDATNDYEIGDASYPMRSKGLSELFVDGVTEDKRYKVVDYFDYQKTYNANNSLKIAYEYFDASTQKWMVYINPAPATGVTIYYSHFYLPVKKTLTTDYIVCPNDMYIVKLTMAYLADAEDEPERATELRQEAELLMRELMALEDMPRQGDILSMRPADNRGIGNY